MSARTVATRLFWLSLVLISGCIVPYGATDRTAVQECAGYGGRWLIKEHVRGRPGIAVVGVHGGWTSSKDHTILTIEKEGGAAMDVARCIAVVQAHGRFKRLEAAEISAAWYRIHVVDDRIFVVLTADPARVTDVPILVADHVYDHDHRIEMLGEWDPGALEFRVDRYFRSSFNSIATSGDLEKAAVFNPAEQ